MIYETRFPPSTRIAIRRILGLVPYGSQDPSFFSDSDVTPDGVNIQQQILVSRQDFLLLLGISHRLAPGISHLFLSDNGGGADGTGVDAFAASREEQLLKQRSFAKALDTL